jgi:hypothetical protein
MAAVGGGIRAGSAARDELASVLLPVTGPASFGRGAIGRLDLRSHRPPLRTFVSRSTRPSRRHSGRAAMLYARPWTRFLPHRSGSQATVGDIEVAPGSGGGRPSRSVCEPGDSRRTHGRSLPGHQVPGRSVDPSAGGAAGERASVAGVTRVGRTAPQHVNDRHLGVVRSSPEGEAGVMQRRRAPRRTPGVARSCRCGHGWEAHQHYRRGSDCSICPRGGCHRYVAAARSFRLVTAGGMRVDRRGSRRL